MTGTNKLPPDHDLKCLNWELKKFRQALLAANTPELEEYFTNKIKELEQEKKTLDNELKN